MDDFTDLVLLAGTNPLPNYVVAKYFMQCNAELKKIWLVHSEQNTAIKQQGTYELAGNIRDVIIGEFGNRVQFRCVSLGNVGSAGDIAGDVKSKLISKLDWVNKQNRTENERVHLNYTGGTKTMAVHVYRGLEKELGADCTFSYLSGRDFKLRHDHGDVVITADLRNKINISLSALIKMHGYEKKEKQNSPVWPEVIKKFSEIIVDGNLGLYLNWKDKVIRNHYYYTGGNFIKTKDAFLKHNKLVSDGGRPGPAIVKQYQKDLLRKTPDFVMELLKLIPRKHALLDEDGQFWVPGNDCVNYKNRLKASVRDFLDGKWLEFYVYSVLQEKMARDNDFKGKPEIPMAVNWVIKKENQVVDFELDVIVLNGYQVCGISCTTSSGRSRCKEKGFEVLHRVGQIGGDEAKAVLITCLPDTKAESLADDLRVISGSSDDKLLVLGQDDLSEDDLWPLLKNFIWK